VVLDEKCEFLLKIKNLAKPSARLALVFTSQKHRALARALRLRERPKLWALLQNIFSNE
jgi:hypothetical protein